jgi:signal peptidase I
MSVNEPGSRTSPGEAPDPDKKDTVAAAATPAAGAAGGAPADGTAAGGAGPGAVGPGAGTAASGKPAPRKRRRHGFLIEFVVLLAVALALSLVVETWVVQAFYIPSGSMQNTLEIGDRILVNKLVYHFRGIARGDIVVFNGAGSWNPAAPPPSSDPLVRFFDDIKGLAGGSESGDVYVKRVIGLPGDHVVCCNAQGRITVNGVALHERSYLYPGNAPSLQRFNITVPPGRLWVMGDHRSISYDSRGHMGDPGGGTIPENEVIGRAFVIIWPPSQWRILNIPSTFEQPALLRSGSAAGGSAGGAQARALAAAVDSGVPLRSAGSVLPLGLGFAGAVPLTAAEAVIRRRLSRRRGRRRGRA